MSTTLLPPRIIVLPGWIYRAIVKYKLNIIDTTSYSKIRPFLATDDLVDWTCLNDFFRLDGVRLSNTQCLAALAINETLTESQISEIEKTILPLSGSHEAALSVQAKLTAVNIIVDVPYRFVRIDTTLFVILNEGFLSALTDSKLKLDFVKAYLKECYAMMAISDVSKLDIFSLYLKLLNNNNDKLSD